MAKGNSLGIVKRLRIGTIDAAKIHSNNKFIGGIIIFNNYKYDEKWLPITDERVKPIYFISNMGQVLNIHGKYIKPFTDKDGYYRYTLQGYGKKIKFYAHRLVGEYFIPKPCTNEKLEINHIDPNRKKYNVYTQYDKNLEWVTHKNNIKHSWDNDKQTVNKPYSYDIEFIEYICYLLEKGYKPKKILNNLNALYSINQSLSKYRTLIKRIKQRKNWTNVSEKYNF